MDQVTHPLISGDVRSATFGTTTRRIPPAPFPSFVLGGGGYIFARKLISSFRDETTHDWRGWIIISQRLSPNDMATDLQRLPTSEGTTTMDV